MSYIRRTEDSTIGSARVNREKEGYFKERYARSLSARNAWRTNGCSDP